MKKALSGVRVVDVTRLLSGPYCSMLLADMGAEVIKVEVPHRGDDARLFGPFRNGESGYFMTFNRGKRGITLDLRKQEGQEVIKDLVKTADIVIENFTAGTMAKWGLGYEDLKAINPRIIFGSITGFGQSGPYAHKTAFDAIAQAIGGIMGITGPEGGMPVRVGSALGDINAGSFLTNGLLAALYQRERTGEGQSVDISMQDCIAAILENAVVRYTMGGEIPTRIGSRHANIAPYDVFSAQDGYVMIACANEATWQRLARCMERPELIEDSRFLLTADRARNVHELEAFINAWTGSHSVKEALKLLEEYAVPAAPVLGIDELVADPQLNARNMFVTMEHPVAGDVTIPGNPIKMSASPDNIEFPAPMLGQDTEQVLREIGYDAVRIARLRANDII